jgi:drug/metabolite transporter superfamily protein YnfA
MKNKGNLFASIGGLFTILSLTVIEDMNWKIAAAALGVALALYGVTLIQKAKK